MGFPPSADECRDVHYHALQLQEKARLTAEAEERNSLMKWDNYLMAFARLASANTKCGSRAIGAAVVIDRRVVATGYNGPACGMDRCSDRWREMFPGIPGRDEYGNFSVDPYDLPGSKFYENPKTGETVAEEGVLNPWPEGNFCPRRAIGYKSGQGLDICVAGHAERNALNQCSRLGISTLGASLYAFCGIPCKDCAIEIVNCGVSEVVCLKTNYEYDAYGRMILEAGGVTIREICDLTDLVIEKVY